LHHTQITTYGRSDETKSTADEQKLHRASADDFATIESATLRKTLKRADACAMEVALNEALVDEDANKNESASRALRVDGRWTHYSYDHGILIATKIARLRASTVGSTPFRRQFVDSKMSPTQQSHYSSSGGLSLPINDDMSTQFHYFAILRSQLSDVCFCGANAIYACWIVYRMTIIPIVEQWREWISPAIEAVAY
jgi:hypothetical protein